MYSFDDVVVMFQMNEPIRRDYHIGWQEQIDYDSWDNDFDNFCAYCALSF